MIEFGETLRKAREAKGLTTAQIAEMTHLVPQTVEDLEKENFTKISAPIYGRGFVKLYCEAVGIDPKPLIAEFMDIYNGNRQPTIHMRQAPKPPARPPQPPQPPPAPLPAQPAENAFAVQSEPAEDFAPAQPQPSPVEEDYGVESPRAESPDVVPAPFSLEQQTISRPPAARPRPLPAYRKPEPIDREAKPFRIPMPPPAFWRILALATVAGLVIWGLATGIRAIYHATMTPPEQTTTAEQQTTTAEQQTTTEQPSAPERQTVVEQKAASGQDTAATAKKAKPAAAPSPAQPARKPREPIAMPPLYID